MKKIILYLSFFIIAYVNSIFVCIGQQQGLILKTEIANPIAIDQDDLLVKLTLFNQIHKQILIHKHIAFGYSSICLDDFCFEVQKKVNNEYRKIEELASIHRIAGYDSTGMAWDDMYDTLAPGQVKRLEFNINGYYSFDRGKYRVRFCFQPTAKNNLPFKRTYSSWLYFEVKTKHITFHL